jgi:uncharacterized membrane protein
VVFGYLPLVPLLEVPAFLVAGDVRWMLLACMLVSAWALGRLGGRTGELAALAVLFQPGTFLVLELAWTEPIVMAAWVLALLLAARCNWDAGRQWAGVGVALGMLVASKQYSPLLFLPVAVAMPRERRWHVVAIAAMAFAVVTLPFVVWDPAEFWRDVVAAQFLQPFRMDGLSFLTALAWATGVQPSSAIGFVLAGVVLLVGLRGGVSLPRAAAIAAAAFLTLVLFSKQAMFNYFWLSTGLLASVIAAWAAEGDRRD